MCVCVWDVGVLCVSMCVYVVCVCMYTVCVCVCVGVWFFVLVCVHGMCAFLFMYMCGYLYMSAYVCVYECVPVSICLCVLTWCNGVVS